jgi:hypothetical protein
MAFSKGSFVLPTDQNIFHLVNQAMKILFMCCSLSLKRLATRVRSQMKQQSSIRRAEVIESHKWRENISIIELSKTSQTSRHPEKGSTEALYRTPSLEAVGLQ